MTGIGPVEPYDPDDAPRPRTPPPPAATDTLGSDSPRLSDRWTALPPRRRRLLALGAAGLTAALATTALLLPSSPDAPALDPWPAQVTHLRYDGPAGPGGTFAFTVRVDRGSAVTISHIQPGTAQLTTHVTPGTPFTTAPGAPRALRVRIGVRGCAALPHALDMTYLDITLHNRRGRQRHSYLFVDRYPHALLDHVHTICRARRAPPGPITPA
ncbi:hypothetical protein ABZ930_30890 [Streptomyces sp. NPDC046716]|uniref:hypothetical protein n=1 Tax=Streptomyces sp. NPDC046716 TaxID=3157093 RepID=UPI003409F3A9